MQHATNLDRNLNLMGKLSGVGQIDYLSSIKHQKGIKSATAGIIHRVELASHGAHKPGGARCVSARPLGSELAHAGLAGIGEVDVNFS